MAVDILNQLQALTTKTASFQGTGVNFPGGTPRRGLKARFIYSGLTNTSGNNTVCFTVDASADNTTYYTISRAEMATSLTAASTLSGEIYVPFETSKAYIRASIEVLGTGTGSTCAYQADVTLGRPA